MDHLHIGLLTGLFTFLMLIPFFFFWRVLAARLADRPIGQAMAFIF